MKTFNHKLKSFQNRLNLQIGLRALLRSVLLFIVGLHIYYLLWKHLDQRGVALLYSNIAIRICLVLGIIYLLWDAYHKLVSLLHTARYLDHFHDMGDDLYQNLYELSKKPENHQVCSVLSQAAESRLRDNKYKLAPLFPAMILLAMLSVVIGIGAIWAIDHQDFGKAFKQFYTNRAEAIVYKDTIELSPGNLQTGKNTQVLIEVINPEQRLQHKLYYRWDKSWRELAMTDYSYIFDSLDRSIDYYVENSVAKSPVYRIEVLDEPYVRSWKLHYRYPLHTNLEPVSDSLSYGNITAYKGSTVRLHIISNVELKSASMHFDNGDILALSPLDNKNFSAELTVDRERSYYIELKDLLDRISPPTEKTISIIPDNPPQIRINFPARDITLDQSMLLPLIFTADDDFGLRNLSIVYSVNQREAQSLMIQEIIPGKLLNRDFVFEMNSLGLLPGDQVEYYLKVYDNSPEAQFATSARYTARFPTMEEIFREIEERQQGNQDQLMNVAEEQREIQQDFEELRRELLNEDNPSWNQQQQLHQLIEDHQTISDQVDQVSQSYQELIQRMQQNTAISPDMMQKMQRIQELMQEINNEELQSALDKMNQALENLSMDDLRRAMENFRFSMEDFAQKLQQTLDLLESVKLEQEIQKALGISQETERMQADLMQETSDSSLSNEELARRQDRTEQSYNALREEMEKLKDMLEASQNPEALEQLQELMQEMQDSNASQDMQNSSNQLKQNQRSQSAQSQSEALRKLRQFTRMLQEMRDSMASGSQSTVMEGIETAIRELLIFSKNHEQTAARFKNDPFVIAQDLISTYEGIQLSLNKLYSNPMVMLYLPPKFFIDLSSTFGAYREYFVALGETTSPRAAELLRNIQSGINLMTYDLIQAMQNQGSGSSGGGGIQSLMQMLQQMSQEQLAMNMLTQQLMQQLQSGGGRMNSSMQSQAQRLASDQQRLADNLKRALQNNPDAQKQGNAINQIIEEAEAVARQLRQGQINRQLLERQERIISRMLDAQKSINQREQSRERRAEAANSQDWGQQIAPISFEELRRRAMLDDGYKVYPREYQDLIIEYLKRINSGENQ